MSNHLHLHVPILIFNERNQKTQTMNVKTLAVLLFNVIAIIAWDDEDMEIYDSVEDINQNFYEVLGVEKTCSSADIRRAYRRLSIKLHPDKNKDEGAEEKFRNLVTVYEILKDDKKRKKYDHVLEYGLPNWKQPVYYFRKARKISLSELFLFLFVIATVGQYLVLWAMFFEKQLSLEDFFSSKKRRSTRKKKDGYDPDSQLQEELAALPRPKISQLLPWLLCCLIYSTIVSIPVYIEKFREHRRKQRELKKIEEEESSDDECEIVRKPKRRQKINLPEYIDYPLSEPVLYSNAIDQSDCEIPEARPLKHGEWTDDELGLLAKAAARYPGGTANRWQKIAQFVGRSVEEVLEKNRHLKSSATSITNTSCQGKSDIDLTLTNKFPKILSDDIISKNLDTNADGLYLSINHTVSGELAEKHVQWEDTHQPSHIQVDKDMQYKTVSQKSRAKVRQNVSETKSQNHTYDSVTAKQGYRFNTNIENVLLPSDSWTQNQQVLLEWALKHITKDVTDRWEKIAAEIPGKTKDECIQRYKHLADMLKQRKQQKTTPSS